MAPPPETVANTSHLVFETELVSVRINSRLAFFWLTRRLYKTGRFLWRTFRMILSVVFGRYEMVQQVGPGIPPVATQRTLSELEADQNLRRGISG